MLTCIALTGHAPIWGFVAISLVGAGSYAMLGPFWAIPTESLPSSVSGPAMGLVNALGNMGGYFGPLIVGIVYDRTGDFRYAFAVLSAALFVAAAVALRLPSRAPGGTISKE
jgi:nitrate/nitrite transporter NarK